MKLVARLAALLCLVSIAAHASFAQAAKPAPQPEEGAQQFADLGELKLRSGGVIHDFRIGYRTLGKLNAEKSNAVLWPTWLNGQTKDMLGYIQRYKIVDPAKYFVILVDAIGDGVSTSPSNSASQHWGDFPEFTIRDMVDSQHRLVTEVFHLTHLRAVVGVSMGGMQAFEWAVAYPEFMDLAVPIVGSPQSTSYDELMWTSEIDAIELDPAWSNGRPTGPLKRGFAVMSEIESLSMTSPAYRAGHTSPAEFEKFLSSTKSGASGDGGVAWNQIRQRQAIIALDVAAEFGVTLEEAARRVRAKLLVIVSSQDHVVNPAPALKFAAAINATTIILDSTCGHISLACISMGPTVAQFLADPGSVRSTTLHDPANQ